MLVQPSLKYWHKVPSTCRLQTTVTQLATGTPCGAVRAKKHWRSRLCGEGCDSIFNGFQTQGKLLMGAEFPCPQHCSDCLPPLPQTFNPHWPRKRWGEEGVTWGLSCRFQAGSKGYHSLQILAMQRPWPAACAQPHR